MPKRRNIKLPSASSHKGNLSFLLQQKNPRLLSCMIDTIGDELMVIRSDGRIAYVNQAAVRGLGYPRKVLLQRKVTDFFRDKVNLKKWKATHFEELKKGKKPVSFEIKRVVKGGKVQTIEVTAAYMYYGAQEYILAVARNITSRIKNEKRIRETDKMQALSLFVSGTAKEITHPLHAILARIQLMVHKYKNRDFEYIGFKEFTDIMGTIQNINNQVRYCYDISNKLLLLKQKTAGIKEGGCDIGEVIKNSMNLLLQQLRLANVKLKLVLSKRLPLAVIQARELDEIIVNITSNALQAMPSGGLYAIKTFVLEKEDRIGIEFKDDGVGIPKEALTHVFEPFFTTKQRGVGQNAGLGLSIVYSIVKSYGGEVSIKSSLRHGTAVKVILPIFRKRHHP